MAENLDNKQGTSEEYHDPWCDPCFDARGRNVSVYGYCRDCFQFLCTDCHATHSKFPVTRGHVILKGAGMPQSQSAKPPRFDFCEIHPTLLKDNFCSLHKIVLCVSCSDAYHKNCPVTSVEDTCKTIQNAEIELLNDAIKGHRENMESTISLIETNLSKIKEQREIMLEKAQATYDKVISKANQMLRNAKEEIDEKYQSHVALLSEYQRSINDTVLRMNVSTNDIDQIKGKQVDTKLFLKIQEIVDDAKQCIDDFKQQTKSLFELSMLFEPDKDTEEFIASSFKLGTASFVKEGFGSVIAANDIVFPVSAPQQPSTIPAVMIRQPDGQMPAGDENQPVRPTASLSTIQATKVASYEVLLKDDTQDCWITGMAVTKDGRLLMGDYSNEKVKMFSQAMNCLSTISLPGLWDIASIGDEEAIVSGNHSLTILDLSEKQLSVKNTIEVPYDIYGISKYNNKLLMTNHSENAPVALINLSGDVDWSLNKDEEDNPLFNYPCYVCSHDGGSSSNVIVSDHDAETLTLLNGTTGKIVYKRIVTGKYPRGVTTDTAGNIYVCYMATAEVAVLSYDLSEERILLSEQDGLSGDMSAIVYDETTNQLIVSYNKVKNAVDCFRLSF